MDYQQALEYVRSFAATSTDPVLDDNALNDCLKRAAIVDGQGASPRNQPRYATTWVAATEVAYGTLIIGNGRYWRCIVSGITDGAEPSWPDISGNPGFNPSTVTDNLATWQDNGAAWIETYNLNLAVAYAWEAKAAAASDRFFFMADGQSFSRNQVIANCLTQADRYRRRISNTVVITRS